jgi:hypothetical protein
VSDRSAGKYHQNSPVADILKLGVWNTDEFMGLRPALWTGISRTPGYVDLKEISDSSKTPSAPRRITKKILSSTKIPN